MKLEPTTIIYSLKCQIANMRSHIFVDILPHTTQVFDHESIRVYYCNFFEAITTFFLHICTRAYEKQLTTITKRFEM